MKTFYFLGLACLLLCPPAAGQERNPPNVLFLAVDDLRPALGCYGDRIAVTPHLDELARQGTVFLRAYCQQAVCSPSRLSLLTGRRPDTIRVWDLSTHFRKALPDVVTLPQHFRQHGYQTLSLGKIFHGSGKPSSDPPSWSQPARFGVVRDPALRYALPENLQGSGLKRNASESAPVADSAYADGVVCDAAIQALDQLKESKSPFFLAVGFRKPHLPFCAPANYWNLYDREAIPLPSFGNHPQDAPELAIRSWQELEGYRDIPAHGRLSPAKVRELRHGYYACVSYVDSLIGRLLNQLTALDLRKQTIVCLWGDHGFHLGEQGLWTKANNYELSTRVPLILSLPDHPEPARDCLALVELVDLYPTLVEACKLPMPGGLEGTSLIPLLQNPERSWKIAVFSQFPRARQGHRHRTHGDLMGYAVRTHDHRYVEWREWSTGKVETRELYHHRNDPHEGINLAADPAQAPLLQTLEQTLAGGWKAALPTN